MELLSTPALLQEAKDIIINSILLTQEKNSKGIRMPIVKSHVWHLGNTATALKVSMSVTTCN